MIIQSPLFNNHSVKEVLANSKQFVNVVKIEGYLELVLDMT
jgi:hypothetical protein